MKILVTLKRVLDPEQRVKLRDGTVDATGVNYVLNAFDEYALEAALRLTEYVHESTERIGEVVILSIGPSEATQQIRNGLAMGADRGILVPGEDDSLDSVQVARIVEAIYRRENPDLLLMGKQTVDGEGNQVAQQVAAFLDLPQACFASSLTLDESEKSLLVNREAEGGMETKKLPLPAVVSVDLRIVLPHAVKNNKTPSDYAYNEGPRYASLRGIMQAKKKPIEELTTESLGLSLAPWVKTLHIEAPPERQGGVVVASVEELVSKLKQEAKVL